MNSPPLSPPPPQPPASDKERLKEAALNGDLSFLKAKIASNAPLEYYLTVFEDERDSHNCVLCGNNILHLALSKKRVDFIREAVQNLQPEAIHQLLTQPRCDENKSNPLHLAVEIGNLDIVKLFLNVYRSSPSFTPKPWMPAFGQEPLCHYALKRPNANEECVLEVLSMDMEFFCNTTDGKGDSLLTSALRRNFTNIALKILRSDTTFSCATADYNPLMLVANVESVSEGEEICRLLLEKKPFLVKERDKTGNSVLHFWVEKGRLWPFEFVLKNNNNGITADVRRAFVELISDTGSLGYYPLHYLRPGGVDIAKILTDTYKREVSGGGIVPWLVENQHRETLVTWALRSGKWDLVFDILLVDGTAITKLDPYWDAYGSTTLHCLRRIYPDRNLLHLAPWLPEDEAIWLVRESPKEYITQKNNEGLTPLHLASEDCVGTLITAMLNKNPSAFTITPLPWIKACEKGNVSAIRAFIDNCPENFEEHCRKYKDSPLHHIKLRDLSQYETFLEKIPGMKDVINVQDSRGATPLHKAIRDKDKSLAEALLNIDSISYKIKDHEKKSARDLLDELCTTDDDWDQMCKRVKLYFYPRIRTAYFEPGTNLSHVRNTLSVVAALLATITFTAGFTLPGGFDQGTGEAVLAKKAAFLVFLITDTLAMCSSMLVLICLIWSMVYDDHSKSLFFVDRSMTLLMVALYCTLLAFMTGVFIVIAPKSLWAAIVIIVMCSLLGVSANRNILYKVLDNLIPSSNTDNKNLIRLMELGKTCLCTGGSTCFKCN